MSRRTVVFLSLLVFVLATLGVTRGDLDDPLETTPEPTTPTHTTTPFPTSTDKAFAKWFKFRNGEWTDGVGVWSLVEGDGEDDDDVIGDINNKNRRGVFAKDERVANGERVAEVDLDACLFVPSTRAGVVLNKVAKTIDEEWALALMLVREVNNGASSRFAPFIATLDESFGSSRLDTLSSDSDTLQALHGTFALAYLEAHKKRDEETWEFICSSVFRKFPNVFQNEVYTKENVFNSLQTVRAFGVRFPIRMDTGEGTTVVAALVPVAHVLPHDPNGAEPCVVVERDNKKVSIRVAAGDPGTELRCHRGTAVAVDDLDLADIAVATSAVSDAEAMWRFGSVSVGNNVRNFVTLMLPGIEVDNTDETKNEKKNKNKNATSARSFLLRHCGSKSKHTMTHDGPSDALTCAVRIAVAADSEVVLLAEKLKKKFGGKELEIDSAVSLLRKPVSETSEALALASLLETIASILDGYPTSDVEDEKLLASVTDDEEEEDEDKDEDIIINKNIIEAVRCRLREKRLLLDALNSMQRRVSTKVPKDLQFDLVPGGETGMGKQSGNSKTAKETANDDGSVSPPHGFKTGKKKYKGEL